MRRRWQPTQPILHAWSRGRGFSTLQSRSLLLDRSTLSVNVNTGRTSSAVRRQLRARSHIWRQEPLSILSFQLASFTSSASSAKSSRSLFDLQEELSSNNGGQPEEAQDGANTALPVSPLHRVPEWLTAPYPTSLPYIRNDALRAEVFRTTLGDQPVDKSLPAAYHFTGLEQLGDAKASELSRLVCMHFLNQNHATYPKISAALHAKEGGKVSLVTNRHFALIANHFDLGPAEVKLGQPGEKRKADAVEAYLYALYLDQGEDAAARWFCPILVKKLYSDAASSGISLPNPMYGPIEGRSEEPQTSPQAKNIWARIKNLFSPPAAIVPQYPPRTPPPRQIRYDGMPLPHWLVACRDGSDCKQKDCYFQHPAQDGKHAWDQPGSFPTLSHVPESTLSQVSDSSENAAPVPPPVSFYEKRVPDRIVQQEQYLKDWEAQLKREWLREAKAASHDQITAAFERVVHPLETAVKQLKEEVNTAHGRISGIAGDDKKLVNKLKSIDVPKLAKLVKLDAGSANEKAVEALKAVGGVELRLAALESSQKGHGVMTGRHLQQQITRLQNDNAEQVKQNTKMEEALSNAVETMKRSFLLAEVSSEFPCIEHSGNRYSSVPVLRWRDVEELLKDEAPQKESHSSNGPAATKNECVQASHAPQLKLAFSRAFTAPSTHSEKEPSLPPVRAPAASATPTSQSKGQKETNIAANLAGNVSSAKAPAADKAAPQKTQPSAFAQTQTGHGRRRARQTLLSNSARMPKKVQPTHKCASIQPDTTEQPLSAQLEKDRKAPNVVDSSLPKADTQSKSGDATSTAELIAREKAAIRAAQAAQQDAPQSMQKAAKLQRAMAAAQIARKAHQRLQKLQPVASEEIVRTDGTKVDGLKTETSNADSLSAKPAISARPAGSSASLPAPSEQTQHPAIETSKAEHVATAQALPKQLSRSAKRRATRAARKQALAMKQANAQIKAEAAQFASRTAESIATKAAERARAANMAASMTTPTCASHQATVSAGSS